RPRARRDLVLRRQRGPLRRPPDQRDGGSCIRQGVKVSDLFYESDADLGALDGQRVAVVGYGNQGRSWALNLRDSGVDVVVCVRNDETRRTAEADGFETADVDAASDADVVCLLVPDDVIPSLPVMPRTDALV